MPTGVKRVATQQTAAGQRGPSQRSMGGERLRCVVTTARREPAVRPEEGTRKALVRTHQRQEGTSSEAVCLNG